MQLVFLHFGDCGEDANKREQPTILAEIDHSGK
jgi:hypothetical protein